MGGWGNARISPLLSLSLSLFSPSSLHVMPCVTFEIKREPRSIFVKKLRNTSHMSASLQLLLVYSLSHVLEPHRG